MNHSFPAVVGLHVTLLSVPAAERHVRHCYNIPPEVGIGWIPYTIIITRDSCGYKAFTSAREFTRWLRAFGLRLRLSPRGKAWGFGLGIRSGYIEAAQ